MGVSDKVSVVLFANSSMLACGLTNSRMTGIETLGDIYSEGGTNFESAISMSVDVLEDSENAEKTILLLSDGESTVSNSTISQAIANGIKINTVYIGEEENSIVMENIAIQTEGESYIATTAEELIDIYSEINVIQRFDMTDGDNDGLADIFEISGMKLSNGQIIYTDPFIADTDNDGLLDGEEIKPIPTHKKEIVFDNVGRGEEIWSYVFKMYTNPNLKDTDGDMVIDECDTKPLEVTFSGSDLETKAAKVIKDNAITIIEMAEEYDVDPRFVAASIFAEQSLNVDWVDSATDWIALFDADMSVGIGQVRISTAIFLEEQGYVDEIYGGINITVPTAGTFERAVAIARYNNLVQNEVNIKHVAAYLRYFIDAWSEEFPEIASRGDILCSLYNLGHKKQPHIDPESNPFGEYASKNFDLMWRLLYIN